MKVMRAVERIIDGDTYIRNGRTVSYRALLVCGHTLRVKPSPKGRPTKAACWECAKAVEAGAALVSGAVKP